MWGWGAMNTTAVKAAAKIRYPMDRFIGNWWSSSHVDVKASGMAKGYRGATFSNNGTDFPAVQDILKLVVEPGKSQTKDSSTVGNVLYNRGVVVAVLVAEGIANAQKLTGKKDITGADMRKGLENMNLTADRLKALGLTGLTVPMKATCEDHSGSHPLFMTQWDGTEWNRTPGGEVNVMKAEVRPLIEAAAEKYISDKPTWQTQKCG